MVDMKAEGMWDVAMHTWIWANRPFLSVRRVKLHPKTTTETRAPFTVRLFSSAQQNIPSCLASPWAQNLPYLVTSLFLKFSPKLCLHQKRRKQTPKDLWFFSTPTTASLTIKKLSSGHSGWKEGRGEEGSRHSRIWSCGAEITRKTFYKVVAAVCFWTHRSKWHSRFQKSKRQVRFSKTEILIKIL